MVYAIVKKENLKIVALTKMPIHELVEVPRLGEQYKIYNTPDYESVDMLCESDDIDPEQVLKCEKDENGVLHILTLYRNRA